MLVEVTFPPRPVAPSLARHALRRLGKVLEPATLDDLVLLVSELVTNSVKHGGLKGDTRIRVRTLATEEAVRVEVIDPSRGFVRDLHPRPPHSSGWGFYLMDHLADRWGIETIDETVVWFEFDRAHADSQN